MSPRTAAGWRTTQASPGRQRYTCNLFQTSPMGSGRSQRAAVWRPYGRKMGVNCFIRCWLKIQRLDLASLET